MTSRRRIFVLITGALSSAILLAGCLGNPPSRSGDGSKPIPLNAAAGALLETDTIKLGFIPILEAAPLVVGVEKGFFAKHGLKVELAKQASWPAARDNLVLGSAGGGIDGGQWQLPMPQMISEGVITDGKKVPMVILAMLMSQGNGIAAANSVKDANLSYNLKGKSEYFANFQKQQGRKFRSAYTFPNANQDIWIRWWYAAGGIDPDKSIELLTVPATETLQGMRNGTMETFSTGDPWPSRISRDDIGYLAALTAQIWPVHPEEFLALRSDWVKSHPKASVALLKGLIETQQWMDKTENRPKVAQILSSRKWYNVPAKVLEESLTGQYQLGAQGKTETNQKLRPLYWASDRGVISYPYKSLTNWFLLEAIRWKFFPGKLDTIDQANQINERTVRSDLWREAAKQVGVPAKDIPTGSSRGKEVFFDGTVYDPADPAGYLNSLKIKR